MRTNMMNNAAVTVDPSGVEIDGLESLLAEMDGEAVVVEEGGVEVEPANDGDIEGTADEVLETVVSEIASSEEKAAAYAEQESGSDLNPDAATAPEVVASESAKPKKPKAEKTGVTRTKGSVNDLPGESFVLVMDDATRDMGEVKTSTLALRPSAKKIAEKFDNLFLSLSAGKLPSCYTVEVFNAVRAAPVASGDIVKALETAGYTLGTSRSQAQQVIQLFSALKVMTKNEGKFVLNPDSVVAVAIATLIDKAPAAAA